MKEFNPSPHDRLVIGGRVYQVMPHPSVPAFAFGQEGRKAFVFQILGGADGQLYALKKFKPAYRVPELVEVCNLLARFSTWPGLEVCDRQCLHPGPHDDALEDYPDLEYAVLMPWIGGSTWYDMVIGERSLNRLGALSVANGTAQVLAALEESSLAHCDIASPNVIINLEMGHTHLIDVEDLYAPGFAPPAALPAGTDGYAHKTASGGLWSPSADRFAGAVLLAEMSAWHTPEIRRAAEEEHYFNPGEMQQDSPRYQLMHDTLVGMDARLSDLFDQAWFSETLDDCPRLKDWYDVVNELLRQEQLAKVVSDWQPITVTATAPEAAAPAAEPARSIPVPEAAAPKPGETPVSAEAAPAISPRPAETSPASASFRPISAPPAGAQSIPAKPLAPAPKRNPPPVSGPVVEWRPLIIPPASAASPGNGAPIPIPAQAEESSPVIAPGRSAPAATPSPPSSDDTTATERSEQDGEPNSSTLLRPVLDLSHVDKHNRPHLVWSESPGATHYILQESNTPEFASARDFKIKAEATRWSPMWGRSGRLFYRIRARSGNESSPWSKVLSIRIAEG